MDTLSSGHKGEMSYQSYLYSSSCGKFLNTLLYQTLNKTEMLETFRWNIRVELTRPVYRVLHKIPTLRKLQIRMQAGDSYYTPPPPLPITIDDHIPHTPLPLSHHSWLPPAPAPAYISLATPMAMEPLPALNGPPPPLHPTLKSASRRNTKRAPSFAPSTLAGFKNLKSIAILDIDDLDVVPELKTCIQGSYNTLTELQLSFSDALASQARRPLADSDTDDSEVEDDFHTGHPQPFNYHNTGPARAFRAQEERKRQERVLSQIFDVEPNLLKRPQLQLHAAESSKAPEAEAQETPQHEFVSAIKGATNKLMAMVNGSKDFSSAQQEVLDVIEKAARKYVDCEEAQKTADKPALANEASQSNLNVSQQTQQADAGANNEIVQSVVLSQVASNESLANNEATVEAITSGMEKLLKDQDASSSDEAAVEHHEIAHSSQENPDGIQNENGAVHRETVAFTAKTKGHRAQPTPIKPSSPTTPADEKKLAEDSATDYIKETRGLSLQVFAAYLVPVKASVLSRALDLSALCEIALLNVGNQAPIWTLLAKENQVRPLPLHTIFTDNASISFLTCLSQLPQLYNLYMIERNVDQSPESFAPRASVSIDQIRRLVLKKHISTLKRLMIKDESREANWDANEKTMILICNAGFKLEELAVSMNMHAVVSDAYNTFIPECNANYAIQHAFIQYFAGLVNLRAINILHFKNTDTCLSVMREILRFIVDTLSHNPKLKLEWIAMEDERVDRVVRPSDFVDEFLQDEDSKKRDRKGKATAFGQNPQGIAASGSSYPTFPDMDGLDSDSDSEDDTFDSGSRLRFKTVGPLQFYDVWGVKIFEKEIRSGRL